MAYIPLNRSQNHIRLLHLSPSFSETDPIKCQFSVASLDDIPEYEALSYVWGSTENKLTVEVDEHSMTITTNLYSAFQHLRLPNQERILWVDALCINQSDNQEKSHQVARMSLIYGKASCVVVWLGEGWSGSDMAMEFVRVLGQDENLHLDPTREPSIEVNGLNLSSWELCENLIRLFDLPWWKRTWTIQEFVLAQNLIFQCSKSTVTRQDMYMARENFWSHKDRCCPEGTLNNRHPELGMNLATAFTIPARLDFIMKTRGYSYSVLSAIATFSTRQVSNPQDRVYGVLGLGTGEYTDLMEPDYTLSLESICETVAIKSVERTGKLEFLSHLFEHKNANFPSFIPNWTAPFDWNEIYENRLQHINWFSASLKMLAEIQFITNRMLISKGIVFDTIEAVCPNALLDFDAESPPLGDIQTLAGVKSSGSDVYGKTDDSRVTALWHSMNGGLEMVLRDSNRFSNRLKGSTDLSKYHKVSAFLTGDRNIRSQLWDTEISHAFLDIETATHGRRFFTTKMGYFGFAPRKCQTGDMVVVLAGGNVPYIIRPLSRIQQLRRIFGYFRRGTGFLNILRAVFKLCSTTCYTILGDSYCHGIMDGEVFDDPERQKQGLKEIVLV